MLRPMKMTTFARVASATTFSGALTLAALMADAEARFTNHGVETAWLACAIGNERAARNAR